MSQNAENKPNEYIVSLEKALSLAVQLKLDDLDVYEAVRLLTAFKNELSPNNRDKVVGLIYFHFKELNLTEIVDLLASLAEINHRHIKLCQKIAWALIHKTNIISDVKVSKQRYDTDDKNEIKSKILHECLRYFRSLRFYEGPLLDYICDYQMSRLRTVDKENYSNANRIIEVLLESLTFFRHKRLDLVEFLEDHPIKNHEDFKTETFLTYSNLIEYKK